MSADPSVELKSAEQPSKPSHTEVGAVDSNVHHGERWEFNADVARVFDDMLRRSIPQYEVMRDSVFKLAARFVQDQTAIVDLGCSRGESLEPLLARFGDRNRFIGVEVSPAMLAAARERFREEIDAGVVDIRQLDLRRSYPPEGASVTLSVLTLQFTPMEYRQRILRNVFKHTVVGGAFILVEKVLGTSAEIDEVMVAEYLALKGANGYSPDEIERKRLALEGRLVPVTAEWNEELLRRAGFGQVDCFWRWMNFAGWLALKC